MKGTQHKAILRGAFLLLTVLYLLNVSVFMHAHTVNGKTVRHAHPNTAKTHQNADEIWLIHQLSTFDSDGLSFFAELIFLPSFVIQQFVTPTQIPFVKAYLTNPPLRGPPVIVNK